jgi:mRNA degradation ribonuclease J1/J2
MLFRHKEFVKTTSVTRENIILIENGDVSSLMENVPQSLTGVRFRTFIDETGFEEITVRLSGNANNWLMKGGNGCGHHRRRDR